VIGVIRCSEFVFVTTNDMNFSRNFCCICVKVGIHFTQVGTRCSIWGHGRLSPYACRVRDTLFDRRGVPAIPLPTPLAGRIYLPSLRGRQRLDDRAGLGSLRDLRLSRLRDSRNDFREHPQAADVVVSSDLVDDVSEDGCERSGATEGSRFGQLQDCVDMVAQIATCHGAAGT